MYMQSALYVMWLVAPLSAIQLSPFSFDLPDFPLNAWLGIVCAVRMWDRSSSRGGGEEAGWGGCRGGGGCMA